MKDVTLKDALRVIDRAITEYGNMHSWYIENGETSLAENYNARRDGIITLKSELLDLLLSKDGK